MPGPVLAALAAGARGIFCEKPLASTLEDADRIVEAVEGAGAHLLVDHTRNYEPAYTGALERVQAGDLGRLTRIVAYLGGRRAMLFRNATHLLGAVRLFAGGGRSGWWPRSTPDSSSTARLTPGPGARTRPSTPGRPS